MAEDLTARARDFALYLPAVQQSVAHRLHDTTAPLREPMPHGLMKRDFDWYDPRNRFWHYKWALASAGHFAQDSRDDIVTNRQEGTFLLGDSGGYQIATGALADAKDWAARRKSPAEIMAQWKDSEAPHRIRAWLETHCDYAMTVDMPLWVQGSKHEATPFHYLSEAQLLELSVHNLEVLNSLRDRDSGCRFLNVLQAYGKDDDEAASLASEDRWFEAVKRFPCEGWSLGGDTGWRGGLYRVLRRLLILKDQHLLEGPRDWCHLLGFSTPLWAVCLTAAQRAIRQTTNPSFSISYDSATPYMTAGKMQQYAIPPALGADMRGWKYGAEKLAMGYVYANDASAGMFGGASPIARLFSLNELNPRSDEMAIKTTDALSDAVLTNHNVYTYVRGSIEANEAVFDRKEAPTTVLEAIALIERLFFTKDWASLLDEHRSELDDVVKAAV